MSLKNVFCWCIVPACRNTGKSTPNKIFINVPSNSIKRKNWLDACGNKTHYSASTRLYCCEDHFDIKEDMENWLEWTMVGGNKRMKNNVVPHKLIDQPNSINIDDARLMEVDQQSCEKLDLNIDNLTLDQNSSTTIDSINVECMESLNFTAEEDSENVSNDVCHDNPFTVMSDKMNVAVQVRIRNSYRSTKVQCKPQTKDRASSPIDLLFENSPSLAINNHQRTNIPPTISNLSPHTTVSSFSTSPSDKFLSTDSSTENEWKSAFQQQQFQKCNLKQTFERIRLSPRKYIGIPSDCMDLLDILHAGNLSDVDIFITLKKIRLNESFAILADDFGMSTSNISRIFTKTLPILAEYLKDFIIWPSSARIKRQLPISFRSRYAAVESIIDCLEIEIEKPTDPVKQSLTWSEYKKCNTVKYLVSCTPDGVVNFISPGFGGRTSDAEIVTQSGYLDCLKPDAAVLADRGFKHIENFMIAKNCILIRPPTVSSEKKPSHDEVIATKRIASLRIHIERLIRRIREFEICEPHSCVNIKLIPQMDNIMTIAAALTNLQGPLIKKT